MYKNILLLAAILICLCFSAHAQTDSTHYDLGRISVKKDFTQSITIKGSDLEKYHFADLADAINVWLSGTFTNPTSVVYVVDGNIINDVNAYSIYDIDQVTLVQNALTTVSGGGAARQMVLIKTRTGGSGKQGIDIAGQAGAARLRDLNHTPGTRTLTNLYDELYLGAYHNFEGAHIAASASYQRDVFPTVGSDNLYINDPSHNNRFKFNLYADTKLWQGSTLSARVNYVPQVDHSALSFSSTTQDITNLQTADEHISQHLFNTAVALNSRIADGFTNTLSAAYNHYNYFGNNNFAYSTENDQVPGTSGYDIQQASDRGSNLLIRDNLSYQKKLGNFNIEPAVNFSYRLVHDTAGTISFMYQDYGSPPSYVISSSSFYSHYKLFLLSPSVNIVYKDIFNVQGGFVSILNPDKQLVGNLPLPSLSPFLSASADISRLASINSISIRVFGSFARQNQVLADQNSALVSYGLPTNAIPYLYSTTGYNGQGATIYSNYDPYKEYSNYQAGLLLGLSKNFTLNYSFIYGYYKTLAAVEVPDGVNGTISGLLYLDDKVVTNRIGLMYDHSSGAFDWKSGINITESRLALVDQPIYNAENFKGHRYTGGFVNRFNYKQFFAGLDVLYQIGERPYTPTTQSVNNPQGNFPNIGNNSFALQNLYAGTRFSVSHLKYIDLFINSRNLIQNKSSDITDNRRFLGLGFKLGL